MKLIGGWRNQIAKICQGKIGSKIDLGSLQVRLTLGIAAFSAVGIGAVALWTSWQMQQQLIKNHKQLLLQYISERFTSSVEYYSQMERPSLGLEPAIAHWSADNLWLWIRGTDGEIAFRSAKLVGRGDRLGTELIQLPTGVLTPEVVLINHRYFIWCSGPLTVKGTNLGQILPKTLPAII